MPSHDRDDQPSPARMKDGEWGEFIDAQPNRKSPEQPVDSSTEESRPRIDHDDPVEEASDESFPASDPPSFTPGSSH
jgi:hypothetical protein